MHAADTQFNIRVLKHEGWFGKLPKLPKVQDAVLQILSIFTVFYHCY